jgi:hypothetical protein
MLIRHLKVTQKAIISHCLCPASQHAQGCRSTYSGPSGLLTAQINAAVGGVYAAARDAEVLVTEAHEGQVCVQHQPDVLHDRADGGARGALVKPSRRCRPSRTESTRTACTGSPRLRLMSRSGVLADRFQGSPHSKIVAPAWSPSRRRARRHRTYTDVTLRAADQPSVTADYALSLMAHPLWPGLHIIANSA